MSAKKIFVVTGANKGIGYAIVRTLARKVDNAVVYLTARNTQLGEAAQMQIAAELGDERKANVAFYQLDITDEYSCTKFAAFIKQTHGQLDVLINNAGFAFARDATEPPEVQAKITIDINYYGTKRVSRHLQPLIRDGGRVVNVCSTIGLVKAFEMSNIKFSSYGNDWIATLTNADVTEDQIDAFVEAYKRACVNDEREARGFPASAYRVSKTAEIAYTLLQGRLLKSRNIAVNACCPGYVSTDMTHHKGLLTIDEGADTPVYLAIAPEVPHNQFVSQRKSMEWF